MLILSTPVYFGKENRFKAYQFDDKRFEILWSESYGNISGRPQQPTIFVQDNQNFDAYGLPEIVFQDFANNIRDIEQLISVVNKRFAE